MSRFQEHRVVMTRMVQLASERTYDNGHMRFKGDGLAGERMTVINDFLGDIEVCVLLLKTDASFAMIAGC